MRLQIPSPPDHIYNQIQTKQEVIVIGTMTSMVSFNGEYSRTFIAVESIRFADSQEVQSSLGKVLLVIKGPWPKHLLPGDTLAVRAELKRPVSPLTPGTFDYARYLAQKNIWVTAFVRSPLFVHQVNDSQAQSLMQKLRYLPERVRTIIGKQIDKSVQGETAGVYRAILIGDRSQVNTAVSESFKGSGTFHILAISGLHMAVIGSILYATLYWLLSRSERLLLKYNVQKIAAFSCLPFLIFYSLLAGMNTPVVRSVIMSTIVIFALCTDRQKSPGPLIGAAVMLILCFDPLQLFTVSFQLSFIAIISIIFLFPILQTLLFKKRDDTNSSNAFIPRLLRWAIAGILVSVTATIATGPVSLYTFNRISLIGPLANLVIEPLLCIWSLTFGFFAIPVIFLYPDLSSLLFQIGAKGLQLGLYAAHLFSIFPFASIRTATPPLWLVYIWYALIILSAILYVSRFFRWAVNSSIVLALSLLVFALSPELFYGQSNNIFKASFLDVGRGTTTLVEYPSGHRLLVDGGSSSTSSVGESIIAPFLWSKGIDHIDAIAITHPDADHYNGLKFVIEHFRPRFLWVRDTYGHDYQYKHLIQFAQEKEDLSVRIPMDGDQLFPESDADLYCVANIGNWQDHSSGKENRRKENSGLVLKSCANDLCILFPGDIAKTYESRLSNNSYKLNATVLLSPHHGSATSNSVQFLQTVSPKDIFVSAGRSANSLFPSQGLRKFCKTTTTNLYTTSQHGTLEIIAGYTTYKIFGYRRKNSNPLMPFERVVLSHPQ